MYLCNSMGRKQEIIDTALEIFNKDGYGNVSTYNISKKLEMSQGNLTYHFPTKQVLINTLAKNMISEIDEFVLNIDNDFSPKDFYNNLYKTFEINLKYKFIYLNYANIILNDDDLNEYFIQNSKDRKKLLYSILESFVKNSYTINDEILSQNDVLADNINLIAVYWVPESEIYHKSKSKKEIIHHHLSLIFRQFSPYLSEKGKANLKGIID